MTLCYEFQITKSSRDSDMRRGLFFGDLFNYDLVGSTEETSTRNNLVIIGGIGGNHSILAVQVTEENSFFYSVVLCTTIPFLYQHHKDEGLLRCRNWARDVPELFIHKT